MKIAQAIATSWTSIDQMMTMNSTHAQSFIAWVTSGDRSWKRKLVAIQMPIGKMNSRDSRAHDAIWTSASARAPSIRLICPEMATAQGTSRAEAAIETMRPNLMDPESLA